MTSEKPGKTSLSSVVLDFVVLDHTNDVKEKGMNQDSLESVMESSSFKQAAAKDPKLAEDVIEAIRLSHRTEQRSETSEMNDLTNNNPSTVSDGHFASSVGSFTFWTSNPTTTWQSITCNNAQTSFASNCKGLTQMEVHFGPTGDPFAKFDIQMANRKSDASMSRFLEEF